MKSSLAGNPWVRASLACVVNLMLAGDPSALELTESTEAWTGTGIQLTFDGNEGLLAMAGPDGPGRLSVLVPPAGPDAAGQSIQIVSRGMSGGTASVFGASGGKESLHRLGEITADGNFRLRVPDELSRTSSQWRLLFEMPAGSSVRLESVRDILLVDDELRRQAVLDATYLNGKPKLLPEVLAPLAELNPTGQWDAQAVSNWAAEQPMLQRLGPWIVMRSNRVLALFLEIENRITLENLVDLEHQVRTNTRRGFWDVGNLWSVSTAGGIRLEPGPGWSVSVGHGDFAGKFVITWTPPANSQLRAVTANLFLNDWSGTTEWKLTWEVAQSSDLYACVFPRVAGIHPQSPNDRLLVPRGHGLLHNNAFASGASYDFSYPSPFMMQFGSYSAPEETDGLYWAVHDGAGFLKRMTVSAAEAGMTFAFTHYAHHGKSLRSWAMRYPVVLAPFAGDWFDAAVSYRNWARRQPWAEGAGMPEGKPSRLLDADGWLWMVGWSDGVRLEGYLDAFQGYRLAVLNHDWRQDPFDVNYPIYAPRDAVKLGQYIATVHEHDGFWIPYFNARAWQRETESWAAQGAGNYEILNRDGTPSLDFFAGNAQSVMDPASDFWQSTVVDFVRNTQQAFSVDGAYLDQLGASFPRLNYRPGAESLGDPSSWTTGQLAIGGRVLEACRQNDPAFVTLTESCTETLISRRDGALLFYIKYLSDFDRWVPAYQAVYHPYDLTMGQPVLARQPQYYLTAAIDLNSGNMPFFNIQPALSQAGAAVEFFRSCMDAYRFHRPFLAWGEMLRPPDTACDRVDVDWEWRGETGVATQQPSVLASAWQAPDGRVLLLAVNHTPEPRSFILTHAGNWFPENAGFFQNEDLYIERRDGRTVIEGVLSEREILPMVVAARPPAPRQAWRQSHFTPSELADPSVSGDDADPDNDQIPNIAEYAIGSDPTAANGSSLAITVVRVDEEPFVEVTLQRNQTASDVVVGWQTSTDLRTWQPAVPSEFSVISLPDQMERVRVRLPTTEDRLFVQPNFAPESSEPAP